MFHGLATVDKSREVERKISTQNANLNTTWHITLFTSGKMKYCLRPLFVYPVCARHLFTVVVVYTKL